MPHRAKPLSLGAIQDLSRTRPGSCRKQKKFMTGKTSILAAIVFAMVASAQAAPLSSSEVDQLIARLENVYQSRGSVEVNFREERQTRILKEPLVDQGKLWFTPPDKVRREITGNSPSTTVIDGNTMTIYYPNQKTAAIYDLNKQPSIRDSVQALTAGLSFQHVRSYFTVEAAKEGSQYTVTLTPTASGFRRFFRSLTLLLDSNLRPLRSDVVTTRNERISTTYSNARHEPISDSVFQFSPPPGTNITHPLGS
jgi:outer membrane lipoprotein-sorting protein